MRNGKKINWNCRSKEMMDFLHRKCISEMNKKRSTNIKQYSIPIEPKMMQYPKSIKC